MAYPHPTWIDIDLKQFLKNIDIIRSHIGKAYFCLPVKANAYGHGLSEIAKAAEGRVDCLGVSCLQEAVDLRQAGIKIPIFVFGAIHEDQINDLIEFNLEFSISSKFKADLVAKKVKPGGLCRVHLEVDTGMQRTGIQCKTATALFQYLKSAPYFDVVGIYSHFASSDSRSDPIALEQLRRFQELLNDPVFKEHRFIAHIANSGGVLYFPSSYLGMVRPGIMTYGYLPSDFPSSFCGMAPCFSLKSRVSYSKILDAGHGIGYGHTYVTQKRTRIVTVPIGYGDGYRRDLSNRGSVLIRGKKFPIAGTICMDQFMVDVGEMDVRVGDEVVLIGKQGDEEIKLTEIAAICNTIPYEILCLFNDRIPRFVH